MGACKVPCSPRRNIGRDLGKTIYNALRKLALTVNTIVIFQM